MKVMVFIIYVIFIYMSNINISYAITSEQHTELLGRDDYKLAYEFFEKELNSLMPLMSTEKYKALSHDILNNIDLEVKYLEETHPFYDRTRMYAIIYASKALQLKWIEKFLADNRDYTSEQFSKFIHNFNLPNIYNYIAKIMETKDEFSVINDIPIQCNYEKDFTDINKNLATASKWLYSISTVDPTFLTFIAGAVLNAGAFVDRQEFRCHFRANVTNAKIYYFYKGLLSDFYQIESEDISKRQFATGINFTSHTIKSNLVAIAIETTQKINGKTVKKFTVYQIDRGNKDLVQVNPDHFKEQIMPLFKKD